MKKFLPIVVFSMGLLCCVPACKKHCNNDDNNGIKYQSSAQITARDFRKCSCCGGYFITIDATQYRFLSLPAGSSLNLEGETLPLNVELNWHHADTTSPCSVDEIIVDGIRKR
jgi:hypothetical protein